MVCVFVASDNWLFLRRSGLADSTAYLFASEELAKQWQVSKLIAAGEIEVVDGGYKATPSGIDDDKESEDFAVRSSPIEAVIDWQYCLGEREYFHVYDAVEVPNDDAS